MQDEKHLADDINSFGSQMAGIDHSPVRTGLVLLGPVAHKTELLYHNITWLAMGVGAEIWLVRAMPFLGRVRHQA